MHIYGNMSAWIMQLLSITTVWRHVLPVQCPCQPTWLIFISCVKLVHASVKEIVFLQCIGGWPIGAARAWNLVFFFVNTICAVIIIIIILQKYITNQKVILWNAKWDFWTKCLKRRRRKPDAFVFKTFHTVETKLKYRAVSKLFCLGLISVLLTV